MKLWEKLVEFINVEDPDDSNDEKKVEGQPETKNKDIPIPQVTRYTFSSRWNAECRNKEEGKIDVIKPLTVEERTSLVDSLKSGHKVVVNLEAMEHDEALRLYDYVCGATYALEGFVNRVSDMVYLFSSGEKSFR